MRSASKKKERRRGGEGGEENQSVARDRLLENTNQAYTEGLGWELAQPDGVHAHCACILCLVGPQASGSPKAQNTGLHSYIWSGAKQQLSLLSLSMRRKNVASRHAHG